MRGSAHVDRRSGFASAAAGLLLFAMGFGSSAIGEVTVRDPGTYVVDRAGVVDDRVEASLNGWLKELEEKTTAQLKVLTVKTTEGEEFFHFVQRHAELWRLGQKGKDNGVLIAVAIAEHEARIHVGYGLESVLPDSWCGSLRRSVFNPNFRSGHFSEGLFQGSVAVANKIADDKKVTLMGIPSFRHQHSSDFPPKLAGLIPFVIILVLIIASRRSRHRGGWGGGGLWNTIFWGSILRDSLRGGRGYSGFGGFRSGFGGGGFGGSFGGGGGFGGGGSGGRW